MRIASFCLIAKKGVYCVHYILLYHYTGLLHLYFTHRFSISFFAVQRYIRSSIESTIEGKKFNCRASAIGSSGYRISARGSHLILAVGCHYTDISIDWVTKCSLCIKVSKVKMVIVSLFLLII